jgi:hypothetical protein
MNTPGTLLVGSFSFAILKMTQSGTTALLRQRRSGETRNIENTPRVTRPLSFANDYQDKRSRDAFHHRHYNTICRRSVACIQTRMWESFMRPDIRAGTHSTCVLPVERCAYHHIPSPSTNCILLYVILLGLLLRARAHTPPGQPSALSGCNVTTVDKASRQPRTRTPSLCFALDLTSSCLLAISASESSVTSSWQSFLCFVLRRLLFH